MKKILLTCLLLQAIAFTGSAQSNIPNSIHFTAVARDANNSPVSNASIYIKVQIYNGDPANGGTQLYCEASPSTTNAFGEFSTDFGNPNFWCTLNSLAGVDWSAGENWIKVSYQPNGNASGTFTDIYTGPFASVPYAFAARTAEKLVTPGATTGQVLKWNGTTWAPGTDNAGSGGTYTAGAGIDISSGNVISNTGTVPVGTVIAYAGSTAPAGWLVCDGTSYSAIGTYATLYSAIGSNWGSGGAGSFNVPDMRGMFLRGKDGTAVNDPDKSTRTANNPGGQTGNNVGSQQGDMLASHSHSTLVTGQNFGGAGGNTQNVAVYGAGTTGSFGGSETRPKNVYVLYIIKY